jgi:hypothetical protein
MALLLAYGLAGAVVRNQTPADSSTAAIVGARIDLLLAVEIANRLTEALFRSGPPL